MPSVLNAALTRDRSTATIGATIDGTTGPASASTHHEAMPPGETARGRTRAKVRDLSTAETLRIIASPGPRPPLHHSLSLSPPSSAPSKTMAACACPS